MTTASPTTPVTSAAPAMPAATAAPAAATLVSSRHSCRDRLLTLMAADPKVVCLDTDTGLFSGVDFAESRTRYIDLGIAEHTAMGAAAAMAAAGWTPFVNTMATFASTRALEAIKINISHNAVRVRILATHGGVAAAHLGPTHYALEDLAVMCALPNMTVVVPADATAAASVVDQVTSLDGPVYVRLGRKSTPLLPGHAEPAVIGRIQRLREGGEMVIVCCGPYPVLASLDAAELLSQAGISVGVLNAHTLKPFDAATLLSHTAGCRLVVTVEEHRGRGGLGDVVAGTLAREAPRRMLTVAIPETLIPGAASQEAILARHGLEARAIAARARAAFESETLTGSLP